MSESPGQEVVVTRVPHMAVPHCCVGCGGEVEEAHGVGGGQGPHVVIGFCSPLPASD
jgi:hypothetical protein